jgi:myo-inositol-hexaphosphate 3-phosphohydrolase
VSRTRRISVLCALSLLAALLASGGTGPSSYAAETPVLVGSDSETVPVLHSGDAMDDPAVWVHPTDPSRSLVLGNDKGGGLETYDLDGTLVQRLAFGSQFWGNVDVRQGVRIAGRTRDVVGAVQRGVRFYDVDPTTRLLSQTTEDSAPIGTNGEGFCLYESPESGRVYGISITIGGSLTQFELLDTDADGLLESQTVRSFAVGSEAEGCVADDDTGALYVSEENEALWRYDAEPDGGTAREAVDVLASSGGHLLNDVEGVTIVDQPDGAGFVVVSVQNAANPDASYFTVYRRGPGNEFVGSFRVGNGTESDDCDRTDGITAATANLGPQFPRGVFICQDNNNDLPGTTGHQNLKLTRLERVVNLDGGTEPPPPPPPPPVESPLTFVGQATRNANSTAFPVSVPATVRAGDLMLLLASQNNTATLGGPGTGWSQIGRTVDGGHVTTVWRRVATAADAGSTVRLTTGTYTKAGVTLAAYRGTAPDAAVASVTGAAEAGSSAGHTTPRVPNSVEGAWRVSYWADESGATTRWAAPPGETVRATTTGSGGGRIGTLLTDPGSALAAGNPATTGGLTATANASSSTATTFTIVLRPAHETPPGDQPPRAEFSSECSGLTCEFDGTASADAEDSIKSYAWDFGDEATGTGATTSHEFARAGTYRVALTVTDSRGASDTLTRQVSVGQPVANVAFVGQATSNTNSVSFRVTTPGTVRTGDLLLLFASQNSTIALTGPGSGWVQAGRVADGSHATTVWRRVATAADAGTAVRLTSGATYTKVGLTLAAYRGVSTTAPLAAVSGRAEPGSWAAHATPSVPNDTDGAWRLSYWSDKSSATTSWSAPASETRRASTAGSGGGRVSTLLTDSGQALVAGTPSATGGVVGTASAASDKATAWTLLLRPAD